MDGILSQLYSYAPALYSRIRELIDDEGITSARIDSQGKHTFKRWKLDYLPLTLSAQQYTTINSGIAQRAKLLNLLLHDLYGEQTIIANGIIPPELIFCHCDYIRRAGRANRRTHRLLFTAADILPTSDGNFHIFADHTSSPSGFGYALAARSILHRAIPQFFDNYQPDSYTRFITTLQLGLQESSPNTRSDPRIALYSPGVHSLSSVDIALVANHIGIITVQAQDLLMRNGKILMRSLGELLPIDILWHRLNPNYLDPLDLCGDSKLGVPGLVEATLRGTVGLVNHIGAGVLANPGLSLYWEKICHYFLDESPLLNYVPVYWGANAQHCNHICTIIRDHTDTTLEIYNFRTGKCIVSSLLSALERNELINYIQARPWEFTAKEWTAPIQVPLGSPLGASQSAQRSVGIRVFSVIEDTKIHTMPGGFGQVLSAIEKSTLWNSDYTKDIWVLDTSSDSPTHRDVHYHQQITATSLRPLRSMNAPPRILNNMFWFGRYTERTEMTVRMLMRIIEELHTPDDNETPYKLLTIIAAITGTDAYHNDLSVQEITNILYMRIYDDTLIGSVTFNMEKFSVAAREIWEQLAFSTAMILTHITDALDRDRFTYAVNSTEESSGEDMLTDNTLTQVHLGLPEMRIALTDTLSGLLAISGIISESLVRDVTWHVMEIGRRLERAIGTIQLIYFYTQQLLTISENLNIKNTQLRDSLLWICDSLISFHNRAYRGKEFHIFLDLLLLDNSNPRSFAFQLQSVIALLQRLPETVYSATSIRIAESTMEKIRGIETQNATPEDIYKLSSTLLEQCFELGAVFESHKLIPEYASQRHLSGLS